jgi:hypothetical protein
VKTYIIDQEDYDLTYFLYAKNIPVIEIQTDWIQTRRFMTFDGAYNLYNVKAS